MDKRIIIKLIANEFTEKTINYKIPDDDAKYDNSLRESLRENSFLVDYEERLDPKEQYEYNVDSKNINKLINIKELDDDIVTHAREFARKNNTNIVNAYVYFDDILLFAYLIRFKANEYPEINWDNPQVMRCNGEEYIKLDYRNTKSFTNKHARLDFKKEENTNGEVYKIINIDRFDKLKENNKTNLIMILIGIIVSGLFVLFFHLMVKEVEIKPNEPEKPLIHSIIYSILITLNIAFGSVGITMIGGGIEDTIKSFIKIWKIKKNSFSNDLVRKEIKKQKKKIKENNIEIIE